MSRQVKHASQENTLATLTDEYDRLFGREVDALRTLADAEAAHLGARERDVGAVAKAARAGKPSPTHSHEGDATDLIASTEILLAGLDTALTEIEAEIARAIEDRRDRFVPIDSLRIPKPSRRLTGGGLVDHITAYFERDDERHRITQERAAEHNAYQASLDVLNKAKWERDKRGEDPRSWVAADHCPPGSLDGLAVRGQPMPSTEPQEWGNVAPLPKPTAERRAQWKRDAAESAAARHQDLGRLSV